MPIEFACQECGTVLRVPDGSSGKRSRCPTCKHEQEIPWVVSDGQQVVPSDKLSIPCPKCQHHLVCSPDLLGKRGRCKKCQHIFTISTKPAVADSAAPALVFHCPKCQQMFEGNEQMRGRKGKCHVCKSVFMIELQTADPQAAKATPTSIPKSSSTSPRPTPAADNRPVVQKPAAAPRTPPVPIPTPAANEEEELFIIEEDPAPAPISQPRPSTPKPAPVPKPKPQPQPQPIASSSPIRFECQQCRGVMEVPGSTAGLETECPYCQTIQTIPNASTPVSQAPAGHGAPAANYSGSIYGNQPAASPTEYDPLGGFDLGAANFGAANLGAANPYAAPTQTWTAPPSTSYASSGSAAVTVGNVLQLGFNSLFPSCLMYMFHMLIFMIVLIVMYVVVFGLVYALRGSGDLSLYVGFAAMIIVFLVVGLMSAWFAGSISRMALDAVRQKPFNFVDAMNPAGAFNSSIMVMGGGILIVFVMYLPAILHATTGALKGLEIVIMGWIILFLPIMLAYGFGTSLALFAGADGESSIESLQTSMRLVFKNLGTLLAVMFITGLISGLLAFFTFGLSYVLPIYMTAALYHLAKK